MQPGTHGPSKGLPTTLLAEGIPPISTRLLERIRKWEYMDLSDILTEIQHKTEDSQVFAEQLAESNNLGPVSRPVKEEEKADHGHGVMATSFLSLCSSFGLRRLDLKGANHGSASPHVPSNSDCKRLAWLPMV